MFKKIIFTSAILVSALSAQASGSVPFGVTGTITPAACNVTLTGGIVNLGVISTVQVRSYGTVGPQYVLPPVLVPFNVTCSAPTAVQVSFVDNLPGKVAPMDSNDAIRFGIVDGTGTTAIGNYQAAFSNIIIDGVGVGQYLLAPNGTSAWSNTTVTGLPAVYAVPGYKTGFAKTTGVTIPDSLTTLAGNMIFEVHLTSSYIQSATNAITPNGSGTMTLVYQ